MEQRYQRIDEASSELGPLGTELIQFLDRPIPVSKEFGSRLSPTFSMGYTPVFPSYIYKYKYTFSEPSITVSPNWQLGYWVVNWFFPLKQTVVILFQIVLSPSKLLSP